ncbi:MAG: class I SAM-dependent methyltransferase [Flavisolibacter sp.]
MKSQTDINYLSHELLEKSRNNFDVIICRHVLEHSYDPIELLCFFYGCLNAGGYLVIEVPNSGSVWAKIFGKYYSGYYLPRHLFHYESSTLKRLLESYTNVSIIYDNTPLLGRSFGYRLGVEIQNTGLFGLALFPVQVIIDEMFRSSSVLLAIAKKPSSAAVH